MGVEFIVAFLYYLFDVYTICNDSTYFIPNIGNLCSFIFFSVSLGVWQFYWHFKQPDLSVILSLVFYFEFHWFLLLSLLFPNLITLESFCSFFHTSLRSEFRLLIWDSSSFVIYAFSAVNFSFDTATVNVHNFILYFF